MPIQKALRSNPDRPSQTNEDRNFHAVSLPGSILGVEREALKSTIKKKKW